METYQDLVAKFQLQPLPAEGGLYRETYRAEGTIPVPGLPSRFKGERNFSTAIYFLLPPGTKSVLHRIHSDEVWHFYSGGPLVICEISPQGEEQRTILGRDYNHGQAFQHVVPAGSWFGAHPLNKTDFCLVGCTVAPGFDFADFELGDRSALLKAFPESKELILALTN